MKSLVIGGGQLGQALARSLGDEATIVSGVQWSDPPTAQRQIAAAADDFLAALHGDRWCIGWSAGAGVVGTPDAVLCHERAALATLIAALERSDRFDPSGGSFFLASSAGGIYASGRGEAYTESSAPTPTSDYGRSKLLQDELVAEWAARLGVRTMIGRISNLYGPRQNIGKAQGFISHLCRAMARRSLFTLTVPVSTIRDFVYTDDVGARVAGWAAEPADGSGGVQVKLIAAGRSVTLGHVISMTSSISHSRARVLLASRPGQIEQPASLRFQSTNLVHLDTLWPTRSLEEGISATWRSTLAGLQASSLHG